MVAITALNGALPTSMLTVVAGSFALRHDAAASYLRARAAGMPAGITTAYRTKAEQQTLLALYGYPRAEYPGRSQHGEGVALDLPEPARTWLVVHGKQFGWARTVMPSEPWHFEYLPGKDPSATTPAPQEDDVLTPEQIAQLARADENAAEARKYLGVLEANLRDAIEQVRAELAEVRENAAETRKYLAPMEARIIADNRAVTDLPDVDLNAIAAAVTDEQDRRARARLG